MSAAKLNALIVPVDGSAHARRALGHAAELAAALDVKLILLHVFHSETPHWLAFLNYPELRDLQTRLTEAELQRIAREAAAEVFADARQALAGKAVAVEEVVLQGDAAEAIVDFAGQQPGGMIVMGSRGNSGMRGLLLGSVSSKVVHHAPCPVTVVR